MTESTAKVIRVRFGGSHRKYARQWRELQPLADLLPLRVGIGSKFFDVRIADSPENRELVKRIGATISRRQ